MTYPFGKQKDMGVSKEIAIATSQTVQRLIDCPPAAQPNAILYEYAI